jgi:phosphopantothenoylcysteine synthetase/decarboxylase
MNVLVTAGNTMALIDQVRCITNIFTGRTGAAIALCAHRRDHSVTLLTSHPEVVKELNKGDEPSGERWRVRPYRTFEDLESAMTELITSGGFDAIVHCAAVSDYLSAGVYAPAEGTTFDAETGRWRGDAPAMLDRKAGKVKSDEDELWIRLKRAPKLVDRVRRDWGFTGVLVKFKLEVGLTDEALLKIAEASRTASNADLMAANTLEGAGAYAYIGPVQGKYEGVMRSDLPRRLMEEVERLASDSSRLAGASG